MGVETLLIAAAATTLTGTALGAYSQYQQAEAMEEQSKVNAETAESRGRLQAQRIRKAAESQKGSAAAVMAENNINVNGAHADVINKAITYDSEKDAMFAIFGGESQAGEYRAQGYNYNKQGKSALWAGAIDIGNQAMGAKHDMDMMSKKGWI